MDSHGSRDVQNKFQWAEVWRSESTWYWGCDAGWNRLCHCSFVQETVRFKGNRWDWRIKDQRASGIAIRDETGFVIAALSKKLQDLRWVDEIEVLVVETAVQLTWEVGLQTAELEENSMTVIKSNSKGTSRWVCNRPPDRWVEIDVLEV